METLVNPRDPFILLYCALARFVFKSLPFSVLLAFSNLKGAYKYAFYRTLRRDVLHNVHRAFGDKRSQKELLRLTRSIIQSVQVWNLCNYMHEKLSLEEIERRFPLLGLENLDEALKQEKGVILLSGHLGPHFITRRILREKGYPVRAVRFRSASKRSAAAPVSRTASRVGELIERKLRIHRYEEPDEARFDVGFNARPLSKFLNKNGILFSMGDGMQSLTYMKVKFLNNTVPFSLGPMSLARATGARVLPVIVTGRMGSRDFKTRIGRPLQLQVTADREEDVRCNTLQFVRCLESQIVEFPYSWRNWLVRNYFERINEYFAVEKDRHARVLGLGRA